MDGNRRFARKQGLMSWFGHNSGIDAAKCAVEFCLQKGIKHLSLFAFSLENFNRSPQELSHLFDLFLKQGFAALEDLIKHGVKIRFVGDRTCFPARLCETIDKLENKTCMFDALHLNILFCYGARQEILAGVKSLAIRIQKGELSADSLSAEDLESHLWMSGVPAPDLIIRTGGVRRLSNFLLYQAAYAEFYFLDCLWPEMTVQHFQGALDFYNDCQRNFGR
jgi:undecaprenyl diphosphate synthase